MEQSQPNPYQTPESDVVKTSAQGYNDGALFSFTGRIGRLRYLAMIMLSYLIGAGLAAAVAGILTAVGAMEGTIGMLVIWVAYLPMIVIGVMAMKRRLNDRDQSGWWQLLSLVPIANIALGFYLLFARGTEGENNYGLPARPNTTRVKVAAFSFILVPIIGILAAIAIPAYQDYVNRSGSASITQQP